MLALKNLDPSHQQENDQSYEEDDWRRRLTSIWSKIVHDYSKRMLTVESDKEAAISGIATRISKLRDNDTVVAGLWGRDLLKELFWEATGSVSRPTRYRAPSWSWLSVDGCVHVYEPIYPGCKELPWVRIEEVQITRLDHRPLAPIQGGRISLRGMLKKIRWSHQPNYRNCDVRVDGIGLWGWRVFCDTYRTFENEEAWCLLLYTSRVQVEGINGAQDLTMKGNGIILSQHGNQTNMEFTRVGSFTANIRGLIPLFVRLLGSTTIDSRTRRCWKEFFQNEYVFSCSPRKVRDMTINMKDRELEELYNFWSSMDFEDLPTQLITVL